MSQNSGQVATLPVITLWETYGSGMQAVAQTLSEKLGIPINQQAFSSEELEEDEQKRKAEAEANPVLDRVLHFLARQSSNTLQSTSSGAYAADFRDKEEATRENTAKVLRMAESGGIIMGRNGTVILADRPNTLHVKLDGRVEDRIDRAASYFGIDRGRAARRQRREDQVRTQMSVELYGWNPNENVEYDLVLNTSLLTADQIVAIIEAALRAKTGE